MGLSHCTGSFPIVELKRILAVNFLMKALPVAFMLALIISACAPPSESPPTQGAPSLFAQVTSSPSAIETPASFDVVTPTGTNQASLFSDLGTEIFRDDFKRALDTDWVWLREDKSNWSLSALPGYLQINAGSGSVNKETIKNLLLRPIPEGVIQIETKLTFRPTKNTQFAGIIMYESPSNFVQVGRSFCEGIPRCVGDGFYMDYYERGGFVAPNYAEAFRETETVYLRLVRRDTTYTLYTSVDGENWTLRGTTTSNMSPLQIGLIAGQNASSVIPASFDYFEVTLLP
jgi:hypothetical protein